MNLSLTSSDDESITIGMASVPSRMKGMLKNVEQLVSSCDQFDLYLNGYPKGFWTKTLDDPKINVYRDRDIGAHGKLYMAHRTRGYFITIDDDLIYPQGFTYAMVQAIEKYKREAIVGVHGALFVQRHDAMQPQSRVLFSHMVYLEHDLPVHMLGTGIMAYHSDAIMFDWRDMEPGKIDEQVAIIAQERRIPMLCIAHPDNWVMEDDNLKFKDCLRRNKEASAKAVERQQRHWDLYIPQCWKEFERF